MKEIKLSKRLAIIIFLLSLVPFIAIGQKRDSFSSEKKAFNKSLNLIEKGNYHLAINKLNWLLDKDSTNLDVLYYLGYCYLNTSDVPDTAALYFKKGLDLIEPGKEYSDIGIDFKVALAETDLVLLKPDEALEIYKGLQKNVPKSDKELHKLVEHKIVACQNAIIYLQNKVEIAVNNLGPKVNSPYDDHSPVLTIKRNLLIFTSRRPTKNSTMLNDGQYPEKIFYSEKVDGKWTKAKLLQTFYNKHKHESASSVSYDGSELYIFHNDYDGKSIYASRFNGKTWDEPQKLPYPINSKADETHASLSADKSTLFFTSNREGGFGGMDIYMVKRDANGQWGKPRNLGDKINTPYDEETPILHADGKTLYFSSEGHNSLGRLDVFYSVMNADSSWSDPVNLGYPINTPDDEFFFVPTVSKNEAYYASSRFGDNEGGADIYHVKFKKDFAGDLAVVEGVIKTDGDVPVGKIRILVTNLSNHRLVGDYRPDPRTGSYLMFLETGNLYEIRQVFGDKSEKVEHLDIPGEKQLAQKHFEKIEYLDVPKEMNYTKTKNIVLFQEVTITPPLLPALSKIDQESKKIEKQLAQVKVKEIILPEEEITEEPEDVVEPNYQYALQILALKRKPLFVYLYFRDLDFSKIKSYKCSDGYTRYIYGVYGGFKAAQGERTDIQQTGRFQDAFIRDFSDIENLAIPGESQTYEEQITENSYPVEEAKL